MLSMMSSSESVHIYSLIQDTLHVGIRLVVLCLAVGSCHKEILAFLQASTPPSSWYLSPEVAELEKLAIFHRNWLVSLPRL